MTTRQDGRDEPGGHRPAGGIGSDAVFRLDKRDEGDHKILKESDGGDRHGDGDQDRGG